ncbi:MAG TPA: LCCL domain-containing protein [Myxococcaceae bacterium]|nr:LCCL domain-containing protein [Myxococcaceae bacterium]
MRSSRVLVVVLVLTGGIAGCLVVAPRALPGSVMGAVGAVSAVGPVIEAGCTYNAGSLQGEAGAVFRIACPGGCMDTGNTWGTGVYTADSTICRAGIHAGAISPAGGVVEVQIEPGRQAYRGSVQHGVSSSDYGGYHRSYRVLNAAEAPPAPPGGEAQVIEAGCSFNAGHIKGEVGSRHIVACPADCARTGSTWGTDVYTADSTICRAAIHAGLLTAAGGRVAVILDPGRPAYRGSDRHGIKSSDYGGYHRSYHLEQP